MLLAERRQELVPVGLCASASFAWYQAKSPFTMPLSCCGLLGNQMAMPLALATLLEPFVQLTVTAPVTAAITASHLASMFASFTLALIW